MPKDKIKCPNEVRGPYWYNEVPPEVFFNADKFKDGHGPLYQQKWQREILDEQFDIQQRQILRDQRMARVYFNPLKLVLTPKNDMVHKAAMKVQRDFKRKEQETVQILAKRRETEMCATYGVNHKEVGGESEIASTMSKFSPGGKICQKIQRMPPYKGKHALRVLPWDTVPGKTARDRFQVKVFRDKLAGHRLLDQESKNVKQYTTTPLAVWRQHRFASPEGCDFRELKQQVRVAKYKAMAQVQELQKSGKLAIGHAKLTSHFKPINVVEDEVPDCDDFFQDQALMAAATKKAAQKAAQMTAHRTAAHKEELEARAEVAIKAGKLAAQRRIAAHGRGRAGDSHTQRVANQDQRRKSKTESRGDYQESLTGVADDEQNRDSKDVGTKRVSQDSGKASFKKAESAPPTSKRGSKSTDAHSGKDMKATPSQAAQGSDPGKTESFFKTAPDSKAPDFTVEDEYLEDLIETCRETRAKLTPSLVPRPIGEYIADPKTDPKYAKCFVKERRNLLFY